MTPPMDVGPVGQAARECCFACGRVLLMGGKQVDTRDGQSPMVGGDCYAKVESAGEAGYQPPQGGPRLWLIQTYVKHPFEPDPFPSLADSCNHKIKSYPAGIDKPERV